MDGCIDTLVIYFGQSRVGKSDRNANVINMHIHIPQHL